MSDEAKDYGEPFRADSEGRLWYGDGAFASTFTDNLGTTEGLDEATIAARAANCLNALRGVRDPEAFVKAADALADMLGGCQLDHHGNCQEHFLENPCRVAAYCAARGVKS